MCDTTRGADVKLESIFRFLKEHKIASGVNDSQKCIITPFTNGRSIIKVVLKAAINLLKEAENVIPMYTWSK